MDKQTVTIYDVAELAGVSMATVSRVVNGNPNVKPATRKKVLDVIDELDYRPNAVARGLASKKTTTVGVIIPELSNPFFARLADGIHDIAVMYHYDILLTSPEEGENGDLAAFNSLLAKQVDGVIIIGYRMSESLRKELQTTRVPVVLAGTALDSNAQVASVNIDHKTATKEAIKMLAKKTEHVALVVGPLTDYINGHKRLEGYKQALVDEGIVYDEGLIFESPYTLDAGNDLAERLINSGAKAAFVTDDLLAVGLLNKLLEIGIKIPEDFQIMSANNTVYTEICRPKLSSVQHPVYDIGAVSMRLLTKMMKNEEIEDKNIILKHSFKAKGSTK